MLVRGMIALALFSSSIAGSTQQGPAQQHPDPVAAKTDNSQKVSCRVIRQGNSPRRFCFKNEVWEKIDSDGLEAADATAITQTYLNRNRCGSFERGGGRGAC